MNDEPPTEKVPEAITYNPPLAARMARRVLPLARKTLPAPVFQRLHRRLYVTYRKYGSRSAYVLHVIWARLFGEVQMRTKTIFTFKLLPYTMGGRKALENAFDLTALVEQKDLEGALVECGVARGGTAAMMALTSRELGTRTREKWFFDSYEGLPDPTGKDFEDGSIGAVVQPLQKGDCLGTLDQVRALMFGKLGFEENHMHLVKGWFQDTVPAYRKEVGPIAVLRLDGDWYESTQIPLENFFDQVVSGGYVIIDDYATCFGSRKATDEFRAGRSDVGPLHPDGRGGAWFEKLKVGV